VNEEKSCVSKANEAVSEFALRIAGAAPAAKRSGADKTPGKRRDKRKPAFAYPEF
jgi:hypothetical protein